jgi:hypothetical protein
VWVAATSTSTVEDAARRRLPVLLGVQDDDEAKAHLLGEHTRTAGTSGLPHASAHLAYVADRTTGVRRLLLMVEVGGSPRRTVANIRRLGRAVLPALRRSAG